MSEDAGSRTRVKQIQEMRKQLSEIDWGECPISARRQADLADKALHHAAEEIEDAE